MVVDLEAASDLLDHIGKHVFSDVDKIVVISIRHVELTGSVLGIVGLIDGLISEILTNLEDSFETAHDQLLQK